MSSIKSSQSANQGKPIPVPPERGIIKISQVNATSVVRKTAEVDWQGYIRVLRKMYIIHCEKFVDKQHQLPPCTQQEFVLVGCQAATIAITMWYSQYWPAERLPSSEFTSQNLGAITSGLQGRKVSLALMAAIRRCFVPRIREGAIFYPILGEYRRRLSANEGCVSSMLFEAHQDGTSPCFSGIWAQLCKQDVADLLRERESSGICVQPPSISVSDVVSKAYAIESSGITGKGALAHMGFSPLVWKKVESLWDHQVDTCFTDAITNRLGSPPFPVPGFISFRTDVDFIMHAMPNTCDAGDYPWDLVYSGWTVGLIRRQQATASSFHSPVSGCSFEITNGPLVRALELCTVSRELQHTSVRYFAENLVHHTGSEALALVSLYSSRQTDFPPLGGGPPPRPPGSGGGSKNPKDSSKSTKGKGKPKGTGSAENAAPQHPPAAAS